MYTFGKETYSSKDRTMFNPAIYKVRVKALKYTGYMYNRRPDQIKCGFCQDARAPETSNSLVRFRKDAKTKVAAKHQLMSLEAKFSSTEDPLNRLDEFKLISELSDRERRKTSVVLHNVDENDNPDKDAETVNEIVKGILGKAEVIQIDMTTKKKRIYRLGRRVHGMNRTIK